MDCEPVVCHVNLFSQPPSSCPIDPLDFGALCSSIPDFASEFHEDQVVEGFGVEKPPCAIILHEYVWEYEEELAVKDDLLQSSPRPFYPNIFCDPAISYMSYENSFPNVAASNHSQDTQDFSLSFDCGEDKSSFLNLPNLSSFLSGNS